jgi:PAS domain S-box-containing protein
MISNAALIAVFFAYGLAFFSLGLAVALETRRATELILGRQLPWLAGFGLIHGLVEWCDMLLLVGLPSQVDLVLLISRTLLLPASALLLVRFGIGLILEAGPPPRWMIFAPIFVLFAAGFLVAYALTTATAEPFTAIDIWSRYLLYFPGCLLTAAGFLRHHRSLSVGRLDDARHLLLWAGVAFGLNALAAGLVVPAAPYGLAPWLNYETIQTWTGLPVQVWRMLSALLVTVFVIRAMGVFEAERRQHLTRLEAQRLIAASVLRESEERFRTTFELAPFGMGIFSPGGHPVRANRALQRMLGYNDAELRSMKWADYTHPDDIAESSRLTRELQDGQRSHFRLVKRYLHRDGHVIWANTAVSTVRDEEGRLQYEIALIEDITMRRQMEEKLRQERERSQAIRLQAQISARETAESWLDCLVDISRHIANMISVDDILVLIVAEAQQLLRADLVNIGLMNDAGDGLELKCQATASQARMLAHEVCLTDAHLLDVVRSGQPHLIPGSENSTQADWYCPTVARRVQAVAVVPLQFDGKPFGAMWAGRFGAQAFEPTDLIGLESLADQAVIAFQHAMMASRVQSLAVIEERARIAREMHDGLAQVLGYLGLQVQTLEALARQGKQDQLLDQLHETRSNIRAAQADVRENILSLRTTMAGEKGLLPALAEYLEEFGVQTGTQTRFDSRVTGSPALTPMAEVQLVRIVQEALANVRKHARACQVALSVSAPNGELSLTLTDDGRGFDPEAVRRDSFGLQTMAERAASVGGSLAIQSTPGQGTEVRIRVPMVNE